MSRSSQLLAGRSVGSWTVFVLATVLVSVAGGFVTLAIAGVSAMGTASCSTGDQRAACSDLWMWILFGGWIAAILAAVLGAVVAARKCKPLWIGYPASAILYALGVLASFAIASG